MKYLFYMSPYTDPWRNLAIDEYFINNLKGDFVLLYLYINDNAVIIGRNQNAWKECNLERMNNDGVRLVRRISGGGAVFHDTGNLNFSFHANDKNYNLDKQIRTILYAVKEMGIQAEFTGRNDITVDGKKFSGNAFCIIKNNHMHHGTLLIDTDMTLLSNYLNVSKLKIRSKGIESVRSRVCNLCDYSPQLTVDQAAIALKNSFSKNYGEFKEYDFPDDTGEKIDELYKKHVSWEWRLGNAMGFDFETECRFPWGGVELHLLVKEGLIEQTEVYTDALDIRLPEEINRILKGSRFNSEEMAKRLLARSNSQQIKDLANHILSLKL